MARTASDMPQGRILTPPVMAPNRKQQVDNAAAKNRSGQKGASQAKSTDRTLEQLNQSLTDMDIGSTSPTKRVTRSSHNNKENNDASSEDVTPHKDYIAPTKLNDGGSEEGGAVSLTEQGKKSLKAINALRGLTLDEVEKLRRPETRRLSTVCQLYFTDHYFGTLSYLHARRERLNSWQTSHASTPEAEKAIAWQSYCGRERAHLRKRRTKLQAPDFYILNQIGQGGYGQVFLARKKDSQEICALKKMNKNLLHKMDEVRHILVERDILTAAKSDWLVKLLYAFQDSDSIYLAMEYVPGGDFRSLLNNSGVLTNRHARFYIAEMFLSVDALHHLGFIHRDLKPENFLIDSTGHIKLTDFGLSSGILSPQRIESMRVKLEQVRDVVVPSRTTAERRTLYHSLRQRDPHYAKSIVGSPDYMAPEVLHGYEYDFTVDYWSLGCMLYECLAGFPPFSGATPEETWSNLKHWKSRLERPVYKRPEDKEWNFQDEAWDLIKRLISSQGKRFADIENVKRHIYFVGNPLFSPIDWDNLRKRTPPFIPDLTNEEDVGYFDDFSNEADMAKYKEVRDKQEQLDKLQDRNAPMKYSAFVGFTFKHAKDATSDKQQRDRDLGIKGRANGMFDTMF